MASKYCCNVFEDEADSWAGTFVYEDNEWRIFTDAEGGRYVIDKPLSYCPFCGAKLQPKKDWRVNNI